MDALERPQRTGQLAHVKCVIAAAVTAADYRVEGVVERPTINAFPIEAAAVCLHPREGIAIDIALWHPISEDDSVLTDRTWLWVEQDAAHAPTDAD